MIMTIYVYSILITWYVSVFALQALFSALLVLLDTTPSPRVKVNEHTAPIPREIRILLQCALHRPNLYEVQSAQRILISNTVLLHV